MDGVRDPRAFALEQELRRIAGNHQRALNRIKWQERIMKAIVILAVVLPILFSLTGCSAFWSNVQQNWRGPCEDRCHGAALR